MADSTHLWIAIPFKAVDLGDGTFALATHIQNTSIAVTGPLTDAELRASPVPVTGPLTDTELRASPVPVLLDSEGAPGDPVPSSAVYIGARDEGTFRGIKVDPITGGLVSITVPHYEIHEGDHYFIKDFTTLANLQVLSFGITVPAEGPVPHITFDVSSTNILTAEVYEGATIQGGTGTPVTPINNNRNSAHTSGITITANPTYSAPGTRISGQQWASRTPGLISREDELLAKLGTTTRIDLTSGANGNVVNYNGTWYEE